MTAGEDTTRLDLIINVEHVSRSTASADSEDLTSDSEAVPDSSTTSDNAFVLATLARAPFETDLGLIKVPNGVEDGLNGLPALLEEEMDSESEDEEGESRADEESPKLLQLALFREKVCHLAFKTRESIVSSIQKSGIVALTLDDLRPADVPVSHSFELEHPRSITHTARRLPPRHNEVVREELRKMLEAGIITPSVSAWSFPIAIASKKDGKLRFCVDCRTFKRRMKAYRWHLPNMEEILDDLEGSSVFTTLALFSGYWQVRMAENFKEKTTFFCRFGTFQFELMPFGLMNAPFTFQRMMDQLFRELVFVSFFLDDVVLFSRTVKEHISHLEDVFKVIDASGLKLKVAKCRQSQTRLLGHIVSGDSVKVDPETFSAIKREKEQSNVTELRSILGLAGYHRRFIPEFAEISAPLHEATSTKRIFKWTAEMLEAFEKLKLKLTSPPVLTFPDFEKLYVVETDASSVAVGAVMAQRKEDRKVHPIQLASRTMTSAERKYYACEREALAVIFGLKKFRV